MGSINYGSQTVSVAFFAAADAKVVNKRHLSIRARGLYSGGYLTKVSDVLVTLSPLVVEIGDDDHQVRVATANPISIIVGVATPYIVLRWGYAETPTNYMDVLALGIGSIVANDIILGKCTFAGSTLTSFDYLERANPDVFDLFLKVEPTIPASMYTRIRAGRVNYGVRNYDVQDQLSPVFTLPTVDPRIDVVYVDSDGLVKVMSGSEGAPPLAPNYNNKKVLAEITLQTASTEITAAMIKDVRSPF
jgi:hypothetical protein